MYYELGDRSRARVLHEANLVRARALGSRDLEASILGALSEYAVDDGRIADAVSLAAASIQLRVELGNPSGLAIELCKCANALVAAGQVQTAIQLLASSSAWHDEVGSRPLPYLAELVERTLTKLHAELDDDAFTEAWERGKRLSVEDASSLAIESLAAIGGVSE